MKSASEVIDTFKDDVCKADRNDLYLLIKYQYTLGKENSEFSRNSKEILSKLDSSYFDKIRVGYLHVGNKKNNNNNILRHLVKRFKVNTEKHKNLDEDLVEIAEAQLERLISLSNNMNKCKVYITNDKHRDNFIKYRDKLASKLKEITSLPDTNYKEHLEKLARADILYSETFLN